MFTKGQRVRVVGYYPKPYLNGEVGTVTSERLMGWMGTEQGEIVRAPGYFVNLDCGFILPKGYGFPEENLVPVDEDWGVLVDWADCLWIPKGVNVDA